MPAHGVVAHRGEIVLFHVDAGAAVVLDDVVFDNAALPVAVIPDPIANIVMDPIVRDEPIAIDGWSDVPKLLFRAVVGDLVVDHLRALGANREVPTPT